MTSPASDIRAKRRRPTIMDVARVAGVAKSSVSQALNQPPERCTLSNESRQRIINVAAELGYRPSWQGRMLVHGKTNMIAIAFRKNIPKIAGLHQEIFEACTNTLAEHGYHAFLLPSSGEAGAFGDLLMDQRVDGCMVVELLHEEIRTVIEQSNTPCVLINVTSNLKVPQVIAGDFEGAIMATRHLIDLGHRRILFFMIEQTMHHYSLQMRINGYEKAMTDAGLAEHIKCASFTTIEEMLSSIPLGPDGYTAIVARAHTEGIELIHALSCQGKRVPDDVSIVAFNDVYPVAYTVPPLTVVAVPGAQLGQKAAELMIEMLQDPESKVRTDLIELSEHMVIRKSTRRIK